MAYPHETGIVSEPNHISVQKTHFPHEEQCTMSAPRITLVQYSGHRDGSALSALSIAKGFRQKGWHVDLIFGINGKLYQESENKNFNTQLIPHKSWLRDERPIGFLRNLWTERTHKRPFIDAFNKSRSQLIYINTSVSLPAAMAAKHLNLPCIWHIREMMQDQGGELKIPPIFKPVIPYILRFNAKHFVYNTHTAYAGMFGKKIGGQVIPVGISPVFESSHETSTACRTQLKLPLDAKLIGIPGGLRKVKGQDWFLNAVKDWMKQNDYIHVSLAGNGSSSFTEQLNRFVDKAGLKERVHFLGNIDNMPAFYRANDVICIPSRGETFGRCAVEAMACQVPVVTTTSGGLKEIVQNNHNGLSIPFGDNDQLLQALNRLLVDDDFARQIAERAFKVYKNLYTESLYFNRITTFAQSVLNRVTR